MYPEPSSFITHVIEVYACNVFFRAGCMVMAPQLLRVANVWADTSTRCHHHCRFSPIGFSDARHVDDNIVLLDVWHAVLLVYR